MKLTILGSGTSTLIHGRACSAYHIKCDEMSIGFDIGCGILMRYLEADIDPFGIDLLIISHFDHVDHVSDLPMLLFSFNYHLTKQRDKPLKIIGPAGLKNFVKRTFNLFPKTLPITYFLEIVEVANVTSINFPSVEVQVTPVIHGTVNSIAARVNCNSASLILSGDTSRCNNLVKLSCSGDVAVLHGAFVEGHADMPSHLSARDVGIVASTASIGKVICSHVYPVGNQNEYLLQVRENYAGPVNFANDLQTFDI